jgi:hypothetical protein
MVTIIEENKWAFRRPLEKVSITTYDTLQTTIDGERHTHTYTNIQKTTIQTRRKNILLLLL